MLEKILNYELSFHLRDLRFLKKSTKPEVAALIVAPSIAALGALATTYEPPASLISPGMNALLFTGAAILAGMKIRRQRMIGAIDNEYYSLISQNDKFDIATQQGEDFDLKSHLDSLPSVGLDGGLNIDQ